MDERSKERQQEIDDLAMLLRGETEQLIRKWEGGSAYVSAGKIADIAERIAQLKR